VCIPNDNVIYSTFTCSPNAIVFCSDTLRYSEVVFPKRATLSLIISRGFLGKDLVDVVGGSEQAHTIVRGLPLGKDSACVEALGEGWDLDGAISSK